MDETTAPVLDPGRPVICPALGRTKTDQLSIVASFVFSRKISLTFELLVPLDRELLQQVMEFERRRLLACENSFDDAGREQRETQDAAEDSPISVENDPTATF